MNRVILLILFFLTSLSSQEINVGVLYKNVFASKKEAKLGAMLWQKQMREKLPDISLNTLFYKDGKNIIEDYKKD